MFLTCFKRHPHPSVPSICLALANMTVSSALLLLANFRQSTRIKIKNKIPPSTISRICHHRRRPLSRTGAVAPLDGIGGFDTEDEDEIVPEVVAVAVVVLPPSGPCTKSDRQMPKLGITLVDPLQSAETQDPERRT